MLHITAHPDDEDGAMLTMYARGKGASVMLLTLTRGEGGQNKMGSALFDALGVVRTLELLASDKYYGVEQRFTRAADFGYSKTAEETFQNWKGHDTVLADMVRVIREFRPDVITSRFQGTRRDGHGHHEAAGILAREAFYAAADPSRFPEQIKEGLQPWQAKKLYVGNVRGTSDWTIELSTDEVDPVLGMSYYQFAMQGLRHQLSQGAADWTPRPGPHFTYYRLAESTLPSQPAGTREKDFFDGIDTAPAVLVERLGYDSPDAGLLRADLAALSDTIAKFSNDVEANRSAIAFRLLRAAGALKERARQLEIASIGQPLKSDLLVHVRGKLLELQEAANLALGLSLSATAHSCDAGKKPLAAATPGQTVCISAVLRNDGPARLMFTAAVPQVPQGWQQPEILGINELLEPGTDMRPRFLVNVPEDATYTRPHWRRDNPTDTLYQVSDPKISTLPLPPPAVVVVAEYSLARGVSGEVRAPVSGNDHAGRLSIVPTLSLSVEPHTRVLPLAAKTADADVEVRSHVSTTVRPVLSIATPPGWRPTPAKVAATVQPGNASEFRFKLFNANTRPGSGEVAVTAEQDGIRYTDGYTIVSRNDLGSFPYFQAARQRLSVVDVRTPVALTVGYVMGAGDEIPSILRQLGVSVAEIETNELSTGDLSKYGTIVLGIRAYDTRRDVRENNKRLLDYVRNGGTLVVQYNADWEEFNIGKWTPYPAEIGRDRVSVEQAPVQIVAPNDPLFTFPNRITSRDFDGWVQERGLYFMSTWSSEYQPLLASSDPGEKPLQGGLLRARYGKGTYIYTGYSFFRQLPMGVPGAIRLFVNLVSAGHQKR